MLTRFVFALALATPVAASAASSGALLLGAGLSIDTPCARHVTIMPDPYLHGVTSIRATADHQEEIDRLVMESHDNVEIGTRPEGCWHSVLHDGPTLDISIHVPVSYPLDIDESGAGGYTIGAVGGPLSLDISGAADVSAASSGKLAIDISGAGSVAIAASQGPADIDISGHGRVTIAQAALPQLAADLSGAGVLDVTAGTIGKLTVDDSGAGAVRIGATVGDAALDISGLGSVHLAHVTGAVQKEVSGVGSVTVGD
jgi:hypothetical protein